MGILADLTYVHMETFTAVDRIERGLTKMRRGPGQNQRNRRVADEMASIAVRLRRDLARFFQRERRELFPRAHRIFGADISEVGQLIHYETAVLDALDRFIAALPDDSSDQYTDQLQLLEQRFGEFVDRFEARRDVERSFYETYSAILFPGGVATE